MKFEMSEEMMNDALDSAFAESGDEEETDAIIGKVCLKFLLLILSINRNTKVSEIFCINFTWYWSPGRLEHFFNVL
jgi:hypothetical protein